MTKDQQQVISRMRSAGFSTSQIAARLGLSRNTVKSFCQRNASLPVAEAHGGCEHCNAPLYPKLGHALPRFCSDKCRSAWWNAHQSELNGKKMVEITCKNCETVFRSFPSKHRVFCSRSCYWQVMRGGHKENE